MISKYEKQPLQGARREFCIEMIKEIDNKELPLKEIIEIKKRICEKLNVSQYMKVKVLTLPFLHGIGILDRRKEKQRYYYYLTDKAKGYLTEETK